jgi:glycosyltransferase involved in cell wall biosynthesis
MRHLIHVFPSFVMGGSQARLVRLINHFDDRYSHSIVSISGDYSALDLIEKRSRVRRLPFVFSGKKSLVNSLKCYRAVLREQRPDVLLTYNWGSIDWAISSLSLNSNHVVVEDGFGPEEAVTRFKRRSFVRGLVIRLNKSRVVVPSMTLSSIALSEWRVPPGRIFYIPNGVDPIRYKSACERGRPSVYSVDPKEIVIGTLAGLRPEKRLDLLIEAVAVIRQSHDVRLVIAGSGPLDEELKSLCRSKGYDRWVNFLGFSANPETVLSEFDIFALSSMTEQLPISMIEAMMSSLPVVSMDVGDVRASLPPEQGQWVIRDSRDDFVNALLKAVENPYERRRLGALNFGFAVDRFASSPMFDAWQSIFDR